MHDTKSLIHSSVHKHYAGQALRGWIVMSEELDNLGQALYFQKVPRAWILSSYPSKLNLGAWLHDLSIRVSSTRQWAQNGPPSVFNIAAFYKPQSFFKATLRVVARKIKVQNDGIWKRHALFSTTARLLQKKSSVHSLEHSK